MDSQQLEIEFKKLSQLDRIEFRQRMSINDGKVINPLFWVSKYYFIGGLMLILYSLLIAPSYGDILFLKFFEIGTDVLKIGVLFLSLEYLYLVYVLWKTSNQKKEILKEYFPKLYGVKK
jgi:hypothetical protein